MNHILRSLPGRTIRKIFGSIPKQIADNILCLFSYDCSNPIFGSTVHPLDPTKSPGGSSGGEGALIKNGGSILGIGTDIAGSIRIPSAFCGICGLKTTSNRIRLYTNSNI